MSAGNDRPPFDAVTAPTFRCPSCGAPSDPAARSCRHCSSLLATRRCVACFQLNPREAERCTRCGALLPKEALAAGAAGPCPDCRLELVPRAFGAVGYAECPRCGGLLLSAASVDAVAKDADTRSRVRLEKPPEIRPAGAPLPPVKYRPCPSCGKLMNRLNYAGGSGVIVDACRDHGTWFDRGELTAIVDFLEGGGWDRVKRRERERLREEVRSLESQKSFNQSIAMPSNEAERTLQGVETIGEMIGFLVSLFRK